MSRLVLCLVAASIGTIPLVARAEDTGGARRITTIQQSANGDTFLTLEGWTCSTIRDFMYMPASTPAGDKLLSVILAAHLSRRAVVVDFSRSANGLQCNLEGITLR